MSEVQLSKKASRQWAIVSEGGEIIYEVARTRREAVFGFMRRVNSDPERGHLTWKDIHFAQAIKVLIVPNGW